VSIATSSGTVTITTTTATNAAVGDLITVAGVTPTGYNGTFVVTAVSNTSPFTVSYANATTGAQTVAGTVSLSSQASVTARSAGTVGQVIRGASGQVADILQVQNSSGTSLLKVDPNGATEVAQTTFGADGLSVSIKGAGSLKTLTTNTTDSTYITFTTSTAHGFLQGQKVEITGSSAAQNGIFKIETVPSPTTFSVLNAFWDGTTGGQARNYANVINFKTNATVDRSFSQGGEFLGTLLVRAGKGNDGSGVSVIGGSGVSGIQDWYSANGTQQASLSVGGTFSTRYLSIFNFDTSAGVASITNTGVAYLKSVLPDAGTTTTAPIVFSAGTNKTSPAVGSVEFNGNNLFVTGNTGSSGRQIMLGSQFGQISTNTSVASNAAWFGATTRPQLISGSNYHFRYFIPFSKVTAGTVTFQINNSASANFTMLAGEVRLYQGATAITMQSGIVAVAAATASSTASASLTAGGTYYAIVEGTVNPSANMRLQVNGIFSAGTATILNGANFTVTDLGATNIGNIA
jgi:hypothetical protein